MKKLKIFFLLLFTCNFCNAQDYKGCWLPEKYVIALSENKTDSLKATLIPLEGIVISEQSIKIQTYCSELNTIKYLKKIQNGKLSYQFLNFHYYINMKCNPKELAEKYKNSKISISKEGEKMILEIVDIDNIERIYFVKKFRKHYFKNIKLSREYLKKL